jgi:hypothetical protein
MNRLLRFLNLEADAALPHSHNTILTWTIRQYKSYKERIRNILHSASTKIHITVDLWSSPNSLAVMGIIAHYINEEGILDNSVLALRNVIGEHTGANQAEIIMDVLDEYGIASKLGYFVMDNATNNDTLVKKLSQCMYPS